MIPKSTNSKLGHLIEWTNFGGKIGALLVILALQEDNFHLLRASLRTIFSVRHAVTHNFFSVTHNFFLLRTSLRTTFIDLASIWLRMLRMLRILLKLQLATFNSSVTSQVAFEMMLEQGRISLTWGWLAGHSRLV